MLYVLGLCVVIHVVRYVYVKFDCVRVCLVVIVDCHYVLMCSVSVYVIVKYGLCVMCLLILAVLCVGVLCLPLCVSVWFVLYVCGTR